MSYCLTPFLVDVPKLRAIIGCRIPEIVTAAKAVCHSRDADEPDVEFDEDEEQVPIGTAIRHLVMGEPLNEDYGHCYGYALMELCHVAGELIGSRAWAPIPGWEAVEACGLGEILFTGPPVELPTIDDFPGIGHELRGDLPARLQAAQARRQRIREPHLVEMLDEYIGWLTLARKKNKDIVFFYT
jgi:hypothetical protein